MDELIAFLRKEIDLDEQTATVTEPGGGHQPVKWRAEPRNGGWAGGWVHIVAEYRFLGDPPDCWEDQPIALASNGRAEHAHIVRHDPARVLREVKAKRAIIERYEMHAKELARLNERAAAGNLAEHQQWKRANLGVRLNEARMALCLLALPYDDRPGYLTEWKP